LEHLRTLAVLGGTGQEGAGIAFRAANAGWRVFLGSREPPKAIAKAEELNRLIGRDLVQGRNLKGAAAEAGLIVLAVPWAAQQSTAQIVAKELQGKILIDVTVPLKPPKVSVVHLLADGTCAQILQAKVGQGVRVVSAFQNVSAHALMKPGKPVECDVLVCADDSDAKAQAISLVEDMGLVGIDAGPLANSVVAEALTSVLIHINRTRKVPAAGIRITGI
jgi:8-hydroxy-5-deazaflavin:NADPH oxidoreductase